MNYIQSENQIDPLTPTIFHEPWWLEIVTRGQYKVAEVSENGRVVGKLPYFLRNRWGLTRGEMPPLTHFLGPAVLDIGDTENGSILKRHAITRELIEKLPVAHSFYFKCHRGISDVMAFQGEGFRTSVQFTHEIHPALSGAVWNSLHSKRRSTITKAKKQLSCSDIIDPSELFRFNEQNLKAYGLTSSYDLDIFQKLVEACLQKKQGRILAARDERGELATATFCVWDKKSYYFLMGTRKPDSYRGALSLLAWESIQDAMQRNLIFDLDGVSNDGSVAFYASFGATITPRYIVTRQSRAGKVASVIRSLYKRDNFYF